MTQIIRRKTRQVNAGGVLIGGGALVSVQTMTNAPAADVSATLAQIKQAAGHGCDLVRCAVPTIKDIPAFAQVVRQSPLPVVADIHFDWRIALGCVEHGAAKIRINPGNMDNWEGIAAVLAACKARGVPVRIGVNGGSVKHKNRADARPLEQALVEEALGYARRFEELGFHDIVLSLKVSDALATIRVNREIAALCDYPLHIGVTEAGVEEDALLKSAIGIGALLADGIGDTIRLSFTGEPVREVIAGRRLLKAAGIIREGVAVLSCPTCGRCRNRNLPQIAAEVRARLQTLRRPLRVAVMGCEVNGPGEAGDADIGIAATPEGFVLFCAGEKKCTLTSEEAVGELVAQALRLAGEDTATSRHK